MTSSPIQVVLFFLWNLIQWMMWFYVIHRLFPPKLSKVAAYTIELGCTVADLLLAYYVVADMTAIRTSMALLWFFLPVLLLHHGSYFRKLVVCFSLLCSMVCTELLHSILMPEAMIMIVNRDFGHAIVIFYYIEYLFFQGILSAAVYFIFRRWSKSVSGYLNSKDGWLFLLFPVSQYILMTGWFFNFYQDLDPSESLVIIIVTSICIASDIMLFRALRRYTETAKLRAQNDLLQKQISVQSSYYQALAQNYSDMSHLRHDIGKHLFTIQVLLQDNKKNEAMQYAAELQQSELVKALMSDCHNTVVSAFLRHKTDILTASGIDMTCHVSLPAHTAVSDTDIIIALGNILDNAAEACKQTDEPYIRLQLIYQDQLLHFEVVNSFAAQPKAKKRRIPYLERGIGSGILQALAEKYNGSFNGYFDGNVYHTVLVLKENAPGIPQ